MIRRRLRRIIQHWALQMAAGVILIVSVFTNLLHVEHGLFAMGAWHILNTLPDLLQGAERIAKKPRMPRFLKRHRKRKAA